MHMLLGLWRFVEVDGDDSSNGKGRTVRDLGCVWFDLSEEFGGMAARQLGPDLQLS